MKLNNFITRALTGAGVVAFVIAGIVIHPIVFLAVFLTITLLGISEFYTLVAKETANPQKIIGAIIGSALFIACFLNSYLSISSKVFLILIPLISVIFIAELYRNLAKPFTNIAFTILGIIYVATPFALFNYLVFSTSHHQSFNSKILLGFFILQWISDTGAYVVGSQFGRTKLFERISPKKTWEGSIGGTIFCLAAAYVLSLFARDLSLFHWIAVALIVVVFGTLGDLTESLFKRSIQIKDSGHILPGHGGILDRFDAVLLSAPVVFAYLQFVAN